ncbi:MAG: hypothetical protein Q4C85_02410 [Actinomyces sp.]|uniref:hypothetical protein n=1 Tax=Actinomyces sp. TaxID=29317 RepID=UPI0026DD0F3B|nr:hypothetical protein [Actinomyces sp.]MDO4242610.1 hypothetical protein [Actinomyces sp.]
MQHLVRLVHAFNLLLLIACTVIIPQQITPTYFPAEASAYIAIGANGVTSAELMKTATAENVVLARARHVGDSQTRTLTIEVVGDDPNAQALAEQPPIGPIFTPTPIAYEHVAPTTEPYGAWYVIGDPPQVRTFLTRIVNTYGPAVIESGLLSPASVSSLWAALRQSPLGISALALQPAIALTVVLSVMRRPQIARIALTCGASPTAITVGTLGAHLARASRWTILPAAAVLLIIGYDVYQSDVLSVHRLMVGILLTLVISTVLATALAALLACTVVTRRTQDIASTATSHLTFALLYLTSLSLVWSFAHASPALGATITDARATHDQALAQTEMPGSYSPTIWYTHEDVVQQIMPRWTKFIRDEEQAGHVLLAWSLPDPSVRDGGTPALFLNNQAAAFFGIPPTADDAATIYLPEHLGETDDAVAERVESLSQWEHGLGAQKTVAAHVERSPDVFTRLPMNLPALSYAGTVSGLTSQDHVLVVVPDGFFSPDNQFSATTLGGLVLLAESDESLTDTLTSYGLDGMVAEIRQIGDGDSAVLRASRTTLGLLAGVALLAAVSAAVTSAVAARAWVEATRRARRIRRLHGRGRVRDVVVGVTLCLPPGLLLLLVGVTADDVTRMLCLTTALLLAVVTVASAASGSPARWHHRHTRQSTLTHLDPS